MTWKDYVRSRGLQPLDVWRFLLPELRSAAPSEMARLWVQDPTFRTWVEQNVDRLCGSDEVPM